MTTHGPGHLLMKRGKRGAAAIVHSDVLSGTNSQLEFLLDIILNPAKAIHEWETIDWCKWLMAGGWTPEEFATIVRRYDNATTCGLVWTANFVAYRCRTCGISPCMSLCAECFQRGDHSGHDFNMFRSQAGGACDCGDTSVMKEIGFCDRHGPKSQEHKPVAPRDLMCITEAIMPRIILRLIQHLRENSKSNNPEAHLSAITDADAYLSMLHDFSAMGAAMRRVMTQALTNPDVYRQLTDPAMAPEACEMAAFLEKSQRAYEEALKTLPNPEPLPEHKDISALQVTLTHQTFLEELVFWTVKFEFPQKVVCLLLNMLPDPDYKEALTQAFVLHYSRISIMLEKASDPDTLSNRVVHVSVQLFSNEALALRMVDRLNLLHIMVISLKYMMTKILIPNTLHDPYKNFHLVVDCARPVMKEHCYWPLVSDLNNVLSHNPVAVRFMSDDSLLEMWFTFLSMFQGMNVNVRELSQHVEFEPNTYYAAFSAELEASAYPMWALLSHLRTPDTVHLTRKVLAAAMNALQDWFDAINMIQLNIAYNNQVSFHLPLHRYLAVFMCQAINIQGLSLSEVLPPPNLLHLIMIHPLRVQVTFYEILNGLWVRNGLQIKGQAMTYIQCNFCNSMVDADLYLLQVCATILPPQTFVQTVLYRFHVMDWLSFSNSQDSSGTSGQGGGAHLEGSSDTDPPMLESCLTFLASIISLRTNLGGDSSKLSELELVTLLCMGDKTHSQLMELMPERCGTASASRDFESILSRVADYRAPNLEASGAMQQGMYSPRPHVWLNLYDPVHVLLRAVHRRDFQSSLDRYNQFLVSSGRMSGGSSAWPPYREPGPVHSAYSDPRRILKSKVFHAVAWIVLYRALTQHSVTEHIISLVVYLLEMAVQITLTDTGSQNNSQVCPTQIKAERSVNDGELEHWFESDWLSCNLRTIITTIALPPQLDIIFDSDSDDDWRSESGGQRTNSNTLAIGGEVDDPLDLESAMTLAIPNSLIPSSTMQHRVGREIFKYKKSLRLPITDHATSLGMLPPGTSTSGGQTSSDIPTTSSTSSDNNPLALPTTDNQVVVAGSKNRGGGSGFHGGESPPDKCLEANESIISLLLKLHSHLSGSPDSFDSSQPYDPSEPRVGDGPQYVGRLLRCIMLLDEDCRESVSRTRERLWPRQPDESERREAELKQKEERRRRARERQQRLMEEFASRQRQFMERQQAAMETTTALTVDESMETGGEKSSTMEVEYDCVICNQSSVSTEDKPMGLAVLVQASSVLGARRRTPPPKLPTTESERQALRQADTMAAAFDQRLEELGRHFEHWSWIMSVNMGWEGGVHVQTCGHHLHLDCLKSYLSSLRSQQRLAADRGEYACPLCRQLANSVLPLLPPPPPSSTPFPPPAPDTADRQLLTEINSMLQTLPQNPRNVTSLMEAMAKSVDDMTNVTYMKYRMKIRPLQIHPPPQDEEFPYQFVFIMSIARTNLEIEVAQRGGNLVSTLSTSQSASDSSAMSAPSTSSTSSTNVSTNILVPKRSAICALLRVLGVRAKMMALWPLWSMCGWGQGLLTHQETSTSSSSTVPLLLVDPSAFLTQLILLLPINLDIAYFTKVVKMLYNLLYFQVVVQLSYRLTPSERVQCTSLDGEADLLEQAFAFVVRSLEGSGVYCDVDEKCSSGGGSLKQAEAQLRQLCLPFLRIAALLRHHLYSQPLPEIYDPEQEFLRLVYYLELIRDGMSIHRFNGGCAVSNPWKPTVEPWLRQLGDFISRSQMSSRSLIQENHILWNQPRLLSLPDLYDKIFQYYHRRQCTQCHSIPRETSICLLCGTLVCLKESCCKQLSVCEAVQHSIDCGAGTAMYLVVTSSYVIVIRGKRACLWGSVYLDSFGEEDRELKRGKPLYLSASRYELLQQQWLAHRFDHMNKKWVWHRDAL